VTGPSISWQLDWFGNVDVIWEDESFERYFTAFARFSRLILHDRRATGLSSRNVPAPSLETRVADLRCALDAAGVTRPVLGGIREGASPNAMLAATEPDRVRSLIWEVPRVPGRGANTSSRACPTAGACIASRPERLLRGRAR
jgi:pimeloyl-ACP methyl ester carboxylesterase